MDLHHFEKPNPNLNQSEKQDQDPYQSQQLGPDPDQFQNSGAVEPIKRTMEGRGRSQRRREYPNEAWKVCRPVHGHKFASPGAKIRMQIQIRIRIKKKKISDPDVADPQHWVTNIVNHKQFFTLRYYTKNY